MWYVNSSAMCSLGGCGASAAVWDGVIKWCGNTFISGQHDNCAISEVAPGDGYIYKRGRWSGINQVCANGSATGDGCDSSRPALYGISRRPQ